MISVWRKRADHIYRIGLVRLRTEAGYSSMLFGLTLMLVMPGCAWVRAQAQQQSEECEKLCHQANMAREAGRLERADELLSEAISKLPRDMEVQRQLADSLWEIGRHPESMRLLERLAEEHPRDVRLSTSLAEKLVEIERYEEALTRLHSALAVEPTATKALELKAKIELIQGDSDRALATYQRLYQQENSQVDALFQMGMIYLKRDQPDQAAPLFRSVLVHPRVSSDQQRDAHWRLGVAYAQSQRWNDAAVELAQAAPIRRMTADDWHSVAYAQYRSGHTNESVDALNHALFLEPEHRESQKLSDVLLQEIAQRQAKSPRYLPATFEQIQP